jgi:capsular polysaccharide export protein
MSQPAMPEAAPPGLHFVFLQGMPCAFFSRIASTLARRGCRATGINFCAGDQLFWRGPATVNYRGRIADWPAFIARFIEREAVTDLVLLGEQLSYHKLAIAAAQARGVRVTVTDFGYLRPDWITLERDGMSGNSRFPRELAEILRLAADLPAADFERLYRDSALQMSIGDLLQCFSSVLLWWLYPHYRHTRPRPHPFIYFPAMGLRLVLGRLRRESVQRRAAALLASKARFFVLPLQLQHDFQIIAYSPFEDLGDAVRLVLESFAQHAAADVRLVVKLHPWDPGLDRWESRVLAMARDCGIAGRVDFLDGGDLDALIRASLGMITVNSTSGLRALQLGSPVKTLGQAIYDIPGLSFQGPLDAFWSQATAPDPAHVSGLLNLMAASIQIRGVFFSEPGQGAAVAAAVERLYTGTVGQCIR